MMNADDIIHETLRRLELRMLGRSSSDIRPNCAFCGRERSFADDNHEATCLYWAWFPRGNT